MAESKCIIIAACNQKGGVGKTTSIIACARAAAAKGARVLLIDLDANALATAIVSKNADFPVDNAYDFLKGRVQTRCIRNAPELKIDYLPSHQSMMRFEGEHQGGKKQIGQLGMMIEKAGYRDIYDYIFIDTPSTVGRVLQNAMGAADAVIVPVCIEYLAFHGMVKIVATIKAAERELQRSIPYYFLVTKFVENEDSSNILNALKNSKMQSNVLGTTIPLDERFSQSIALNASDGGNESMKRYEKILEGIAAILRAR